MSRFTELLTEYRNAAYPLLAVQTHEEIRVLDELKAGMGTVPLYEWSGTVGFHVHRSDAPPVKEINPQKALEAIMKFPNDSLVVLKDFHVVLSNALIIRLLRDMLPHLEGTAKTILFLSPTLTVPVELEKDLTVIPFPLPRQDELAGILDKLLAEQQTAGNTIPITERAPLLSAAAGLTANEARNAFSLAIAKHGGFDDDAVRTVLDEKASALRRGNLVTWVKPQLDMSKLGGFGHVKRHLQMIAPIFWHPDDAEAFGLRVEDWPRSIAFVGVPGTGKSLAAKIIANYLKVGLVRSDFGQVFGSHVGESEHNIRMRNETVEAMAPVVDWWDEAEKGLAGVSGSRENPWEARVGGTLLTWFEEHRSRVLVTATINKQEALPPEMLSRFQRVFFVDLPSGEECEEILRIHCMERPMIVADARDLADLATIASTKGMSGREIRNAVQLACQMAFAAKSKEVKGVHLEAAVAKIKPLSKTRPKDLEAIRAWARENDVEYASDALDNTNVAAARRVKAAQR